MESMPAPTPSLPDQDSVDLEALVEQQKALEAEMVNAGAEKYVRGLQKKVELGLEASTSYGLQIVDEIMTKTVPWLEDYMAKAEADKLNGRYPAASLYLGMLPLEVSAYLSAKIVIDGISARESLLAVAYRVASAIEDEVWLRHARTKMRAFFEVISKDMNARSERMERKRRTLIKRMQKAGIAWEGWKRRDKALLGVCLINALLETTPYFKAEMRYDSHNRRRDYLEATEAFVIRANIATDKSTVWAPEYYPMISPPLDWKGPRGGGYYTLRKGRDLVKGKNKNYLDELENLEMPTVYDSVNTVQATAWRVNPNTLEVVNQVIQTPSQLGIFPSRERAPYPQKPDDIETNLESKRNYAKMCASIAREERQRVSQVVQLDKTVWVANKFVGYSQIYFPHQLDFRGRLYPIPSLLNPQGPDIAKGLLMFAEAKPLGTQNAADWLAIHGANLYGVDKCDFKERIKWVKDNEAMILASAAQPLDCLFWTKTEDPVQFLAFCFEWAGYKREGLAYKCALPISVDGSCNGLQHFSAMLRDPVGGAAVNLIPSAKPNDIYQTVADKTITKLKAKIGEEIAQQWLAFGINRKTTKRCVMVLPYGGTLYAFKKFIQEHIIDRLKAGETNVFGDNFIRHKSANHISPAAGFLAQVIQEAISETVVAAIKAMDWLQEMTKPIVKKGLPIQWTTPAGFPVQQLYYQYGSERVETILHGRRTNFYRRVELIKIDGRRQRNGIAPNFVHSLDAAALMITVCAAKGCGVGSFAMVHDSYGTHACDMLALTICLRHAFVGMYKEDVIAKFMKEIKSISPKNTEFPEAPVKGNLELSAVLKSEFFFA